MDNKYKCVYRIVEKVFGKFKQDTTGFIAYDLYGTPEF